MQRCSCHLSDIDVGRVWKYLLCPVWRCLNQSEIDVFSCRFEPFSNSREHGNGVGNPLISKVADHQPAPFPWLQSHPWCCCCCSCCSCSCSCSCCLLHCRSSPSNIIKSPQNDMAPGCRVFPWCQTSPERSPVVARSPFRARGLQPGHPEAFAPENRQRKL